MPRPCQCGACFLCTLWATRADYRALWEGPAPEPLPGPAEMAERELAGMLDRLRACKHRGRALPGPVLRSCFFH